MQRELNMRVGRDTVAAPAEVRESWFHEYSFALLHEAHELSDCSEWKWWSKTIKENPEVMFKKIRDLENAKIEAIDILHFLVSVFQVLGMTAEDVMKVYEMKHAVNHKRQDNDYDVNHKTEDDNNQIKDALRQKN